VQFFTHGIPTNIFIIVDTLLGIQRDIQVDTLNYEAKQQNIEKGTILGAD